MKSFIYFLILAAFAVSCSDDDNSSNPVADSCALLSQTENTFTAQNNPCAIAVSPAGYIAVSEFNVLLTANFDADQIKTFTLK